MNSAVARVLTRAAGGVLARNILRAGREMERVARLNDTEVAAYQLAKLNRLLAHFRGIRFYADTLAAAGMGEGALADHTDIRRLPVVTKHLLTNHLPDIAARPDAHRLGATSGSTGVNFKFYHSREMLVQRSAAVRRAYAAVGVEMWGDRTVSIWGVVRRGSFRTRLATGVKHFFLNSTVWQGVGMDDAAGVDYLRRLARVRPRLLVGYPSYLRQLALTGQRVRLSPYRPAAVVCSGEMLLDEDRALIEGYFGAPVYNRYGSVEFGLIAQECPHHGALHIPPTRFLVETAEDGDLLITDLDNTATPFIRYAIGDAGRVGDEPCACGHRAASLLALEGRTHDVICTPSGKLLPGQFWTIVSKTVEGIDELQLVQHAPNRLELRIKVSSAYRDEFAEVLRHRLRQLAGDEIRLDVVKVDRIEPTTGGKRRFIINAQETPHADR